VRITRVDTFWAAGLAVTLAVTLMVSISLAAQVPAPPAGGAAGVAQGQAPAAGAAQPAGQRGQRGQANAAPALPVPRWPDGKPRLSALPGLRGLWNGGGGGAAEIPYQPWARAMMEFRQENEMEPHTRCKPSGGPRQFLTPYGVEILDVPELQRIFIMDVGGPHTYRVIFMDGRPHPKDLQPSYYGHSIGRWEGDTLVVDTVGFNERFWMDRWAAPHTEALHLIEKFTRTDSNTMEYELTVDDPGTYTSTWSRSSSMRFNPNQELFEYICQDNNFASELLVGQQGTVDRSSPIVP
jgi:hypothetical protein